MTKPERSFRQHDRVIFKRWIPTHLTTASLYRNRAMYLYHTLPIWHFVYHSNAKTLRTLRTLRFYDKMADNIVFLILVCSIHWWSFWKQRTDRLESVWCILLVRHMSNLFLSGFISQSCGTCIEHQSFLHIDYLKSMTIKLELKWNGYWLQG